jgi:hypothetical protein
MYLVLFFFFFFEVYLSGVNYAWDNYGFDFGDNRYVSAAKVNYERWLQEVAAAGGNAIRELMFLPVLSLRTVNPPLLVSVMKKKKKD